MSRRSERELEFAWPYKRCDQLAFLDGHCAGLRLAGRGAAARGVRQSQAGGAPDRPRATGAVGVVFSVGQPLSV